MQRVQDSIIIAMISIGFFVAGLVAAYSLKIEMPLVGFEVFPAIDLLLFALAVIVFSMLFFGRLTPLFFFLVGANQAGLLATKPLLLFFNALPLFLAGLTGTLFGLLLLDDLEGRDNLYAHKKELLVWLAISVAAAIIVGLLNAQIAEANAMLLNAIGIVAK